MQSQAHSLAQKPSEAPVRSRHWQAKAEAFLARHPACAVCGRQTPVQVHHIIPVPFCLALGRADLELDDRNLITLCHSRDGVLCDDHHLYVGHLGDYRSFNLKVRADAGGRFRNAVKARLWFSLERIQSLQEMLATFPHLDQMTETQRAELRRTLDERFPLADGN